MKYTNRKPSKVATLTLEFKTSYLANIFSAGKAVFDFNSDSDNLIVCSIIDALASFKRNISPSAGASIVNSAVVNKYVNNPFKAKLSIMAEGKAVQNVKGGYYTIQYDFYVLDSKAKVIKNQIYVPHDSVIYEVSNNNIFRGYVSDLKYNKILFLRSDKDQKRVDVTYIMDETYYRNEDGHFVRFLFIDNRALIVENQIVRSVAKSAKGIAFISNSGREIFIDKADFEVGKKFKLIILGSEETNNDAEFITYNLSEINPALKGKVNALLINDEVFLSGK